MDQKEIRFIDFINEKFQKEISEYKIEFNDISCVDECIENIEEDNVEDFINGEIKQKDLTYRLYPTDKVNDKRYMLITINKVKRTLTAIILIKE